MQGMDKKQAGKKSGVNLDLPSDRQAITKDQAIKKINLKNKVALPVCLTDNKIKADKLLYKEAQYFYSQRKVSLQRQIVIDNLHYLMQREILEFTNQSPEEVMKTQRIKKTLDTAKRVIKVTDPVAAKRRKEMQQMLKKAEVEKEKALDNVMGQIKI